MARSGPKEEQQTKSEPGVDSQQLNHANANPSH